MTTTLTPKTTTLTPKTTMLTPKTLAHSPPAHSPPARALPEPPALLPPTEAYPWPSAPLDSERLRRYLATCYACGVGYVLGAKAGDLLAVPPDYHNVDCSGWARAAIAVATNGRTILPDGSVCQNDWCAAQGLKRSDYRSSRLLDGLTRIAFIRAGYLHTVGHVYLVQNGRTLESWGGHGPGSRPIGVHVLSEETTDTYVLALRG